MRVRKFTACLLVLGMAGFGMAGQAGAEHRPGAVYVSPVLAHWMAYQHQNQLKDGLLWGARVGVDITPTIAVEVLGVRGVTQVDHVTDRLPAGITTIKAKYDAYGAGIRLNLPGFRRYVPFLSLAAGKAKAKFDAPITSINYAKADVHETEKRNVFIFGAGTAIFLTRNVALRFEVQDHFVNKDFISGDQLGISKTHNWEYGAGLTFLLGGRKQALATSPVSTTVDVPSRPVPVKEIPVKEPVRKPLVKWVDSDGDGVPDSMDKCPGTPEGVPVDRNGCPVQVPEEYEIMCLFDFDKSAIKPAFTRALDDLAALVIKTGARLRVTGYADQTGTREYNVELADRRANAVKDYLVARNVSAQRLELIAFGEYPIDGSGNPVAYYQRCVQFKLIK